MSNQGLGFEEGFSPYLKSIADILSKGIYDKGVLQQKENQRLLEEDKQKKMQQTALNIVKGGQPITNSVTGQEIPQRQTITAPGQIGSVNTFKPYTVQEKLDKLGQLDTKGLTYYNALNKLLTPKKVNYDYLKFNRPEGIYGFNNDTNKMEQIQAGNPFYKSQPIKPLNTVTGYRKEDNQKTTRKFYSPEDAKTLGLPEGQNYQDIPTGFYKDPKTKETKFNLDKYKTFLQSEETKYSQINKTISDYVNKGIPNQGLRELANQQLDQQESTFYQGMMPDAKDYIDKNYYDELKNSNPPDTYEYTDRAGLKKDVLEGAKEDFINGKIQVDMSNYPAPPGMDSNEWENEIKAQTYKSILLWAKLKFDRI